jgi:GDPmannose 4,6-dehydratase
MTVAFVTGIAGQDGRLLAQRLAGEGVQVHGMVLPSDDLAAVAALLPAGVRLHAADLTDAGAVAGAIGEAAPDEVYNLGGISSVALSWEQPALTGAVTGLGAVHVYAAAAAVQERTGRRVRVVQASSSEIFGEPDRTPQDEGTSIRPVSPYGAAKAYAHHMAHAFRSRGLFVATCIFYGHESPLRPETFVTRKITAAVARIARDGGTVTLGNLDARRDWGWAPDYVDAMVRAVRHDEPDDFVVASGQAHSVADFVVAAMRHAGVADWKAHVVSDPALVRPAEAAVQVGDASKARRVLGWAPSVGFDELVARMVDHDVALLAAG